MSSNNLRNNELEFTPTFGTQLRKEESEFEELIALRGIL